MDKLLYGADLATESNEIFNYKLSNREIEMQNNNLNYYFKLIHLHMFL
jgi:hypothetical protein